VGEDGFNTFSSYNNLYKDFHSQWEVDVRIIIAPSILNHYFNQVEKKDHIFQH
jgi:hypothetical protein